MKSNKLFFESYLLYFLLLITAIMNKAGNFMLPPQWRTATDSPAILILKGISVLVLILNFTAIVRFGIIVQRRVQECLKYLNGNTTFFGIFNIENLLIMFLIARVIRAAELFFEVIWKFPHASLGLVRSLLISYGEVLNSLYRASLGTSASRMVTFSFIALFIIFAIADNIKKRPS